VGRALARREGIEAGQEIAVVGQDVDGSIASELYQVAGIVATPVDLVNTQGLVVSLADAQDLLRLEDGAHEIVVRVGDPERVDAVLARLRSLDELAGLEVLPWRELAAQLVSLVGMVDAYTWIILVIVFVAAAAGIANTMLMSTFERIHELGMLLSLGCRPGRLGTIILLEAVILGLVGVAVGTALGWGLVLATAESGLDYAALGGGAETYEVSFKGVQMSSLVYPRIYLRDVVSGITAVTLTALAAVAWPAWHVARLEPVEAMRA
jgi:ABC-type lipoprotein release transport system permease subunit